jgi:subtilisin
MRISLVVLSLSLATLLLAGCSSGKHRASTTTGQGPNNAAGKLQGPAPSVRHGFPRRSNTVGRPTFAQDTTPASDANAEQALGGPLPMGTTAQSSWVRLSQKAQAKGTVPVIVELRATGRADPLLTPTERAKQRSKFANVRKALFADLKGKGFTHPKTFQTIPFVALQATPEALAALKSSNHVAAVSEDRAFPLPERRFMLQSSSPNSWMNLNPWWDHYKIGVNTAWSKGYDGRGWTIAIIDSGVQTNHPWLAGKVVREACFATYDDGRGACPNGAAVQYGAGAAAPCTFHEHCGHGTHVAGIAAGKYGVARAAKIIAIQVFHQGDCSDFFGYSEICPQSRNSDEIRALEYVYNLRGTYAIAAANLSLGDASKQYPQPCDGANAETIAFSWKAYYLRAARIATVVSSGNDGSSTGIDAPGCISQNVSVGNTTLDYDGVDAVYSGDGGSNSDPYLSILAPGTAICSSFPTSYGVDDCRAGDVNHQWTGTSMAAPQVAGAIAVLKQLRPAATVEAEVAALQASGPKILDDRNNVTKSRISVWDAVVYLYNH